MKNKDEIRELVDYFQNNSHTPLQVDEEAMLSAYHSDYHKQSLATKILSIFGGFLGCLAFIGFLLIAGLYDSEIGLVVLGGIFIIGSIAINKVYEKLVLDTVSISAYAIGHLLLALGSSQLKLDEQIIALIAMAIAGGTLALVQRYMLSFISVLLICGSILFLIIDNNGHDMIPIYVVALSLIMSYLYLNEAKIISYNTKLSKLYNPLRIGFIFSFLVGLFMLSKRGFFPISHEYIWISSVLITAVIIYFITKLLPIFGSIQIGFKIAIYILSALALLLTAQSPAISGSILLMLLSFQVQYKTGFIISIIAFIYFMGQYYYDLEFTLLTKSILLFATGILFLVLYLFTQKKLTSDEKI